MAKNIVVDENSYTKITSQYVSSTESDFNTYYITGFYTVNLTIGIASNAPVAGTNIWHLNVIQTDSNTITQEASTYNTNTGLIIKYTRKKLAGSWESWIESMTINNYALMSNPTITNLSVAGYLYGDFYNDYYNYYKGISNGFIALQGKIFIQNYAGDKTAQIKQNGTLIYTGEHLYCLGKSHSGNQIRAIYLNDFSGSGDSLLNFGGSPNAYDIGCACWDGGFVYISYDANTNYISTIQRPQDGTSNHVLIHSNSITIGSGIYTKFLSIANNYLYILDSSTIQNLIKLNRADYATGLVTWGNIDLAGSSTALSSSATSCNSLFYDGSRYIYFDDGNYIKRFDVTLGTNGIVDATWSVNIGQTTKKYGLVSDGIYLFAIGTGVNIKRINIRFKNIDTLTLSIAPYSNLLYTGRYLYCGTVTSGGSIHIYKINPYTFTVVQDYSETNSYNVTFITFDESNQIYWASDTNGANTDYLYRYLSI